ncbi:Fructosamine/Ketosamine-3-kinase [Chaetomidium leptoderma]|uniref:protein-ribulosamine 3-kinase n=1 Tax=Chaetomidium leptoderma TaxID=669021 RepID=A0AAN6ZZY0_9PEZI|nr:Fructosamine/Ketosamine-3-kinase [Chaetomidium leptoderma]
MAPNVDPAILEALGLEATSSKLIAHGDSGFSSTYKLTATHDGQDLIFFVKTGTGPEADIMFRGEHASLNAIHSASPSLHLTPRSHAHGALRSSPGKFFLATDFLDLGSSAATTKTGTGTGTGLSLAAKLAKLHTTPAPVPKGYSKPMFGFPVPTCCGSTRQVNTWTESWAEFYADHRLRAVLREGARQQGHDMELADAVEKVAGVVVPRLLGDGHLKQGGSGGGVVVPVVVHGDLWSGNHGRGRIANQKGVEEVVFDPSCVYGHSEYELGIMRMFGGFGSGFWSEYESLVPKAEPKEEWDDRLALYELYHQLNHYAMFGGGYRSGAMSIMRKLVSKYGGASG